MDSDEASVIEDYESSLEDLTFNSKPLINVLTMLAEENRKHAVVIVKLIQRRIIKVEQLQKLPTLYLLDSIIKNVGREYLNLIAQVIDSVFTAVFEKADEKTRRDLHKLRNTWPQYFSAKILYDLDVKVKKLDPAWPIAVVPPPSPTIHINPKFLKKVEESGSGSPAEVVVRQDSVVQEQQSRLIQLQKLQEEQLALTEREIEEHKLKRELLLKKQMQERQLLIKQQQEQMLKLRLQADQKGLSSDSDTENSSVPSPMEVAEQSPSSTSFAVPESVDTLGKVVNNTPQTTTARDPRLRKNGPPMVNDDKIRETEEELRHTKPKDIRKSERNAVQNDSNVLPVENLNDSVEPQVDSEQIKLKPGSERGMQLDYNHGRHERAKRPWVRRETNNKKVDGRDSRSKDMNRRKRERKRNRGRGFNRGGREQQDKARPDRNAQHFIQRHLEDQQERDFLTSDRRKTLIEEPLMKKPKGLFEHHEISEIRGHHSASPHIDPLRRDCPENHELNLLHREHFDPREQGHGHPPSHFRRNSPSRPVNLDIPPGRRKEMLRQEYEHHPPANRWHDNYDQWQFRPTFEIPQELTLDHKAEIMSQAERRLSTGDLSKEQHTDLMEKLEQFYELQKQQEKFQQMNFERQHLEPRHEPDDYGRSPQETFSHGDSRTVLPRTHMMLGDTGINDGPGQPRKHDGPFHPFDHPRFLPPVDYQGPFRPPGERHPDFSMDRHRHPAPMGRPRPGDHPGQRIEDLMEHDNPGQFVPFERTHRHLDEASRVHSMDKQGPNQDFGPGMDHHFHPLDHRGPFEPEGDHMRHGFPVEAMRDEPMSHGWPINPPEHWQHESGRLLGPIHDRGRSSPCMDMDVPREEFLGNPDVSKPGFRPDLRRAPPVNQRTHQEMDTVPSSMGPVRSSQFEPGPSEQAVKPREDLRPNIVMPQTPPRDQMMPDTGKPFTPNTMLQKKSVDDLFQRLVSVGIIKVMPEQVQEPPTRSATPPQPPPPTTSVKSKLNENVTETKTEEDTKIPEIKLFPNELKKRHKAIIDKLCSGTQCSSCGLRFPGDVTVKYREHLDWHFRMNRREKDGRRVAHRQWYITFKDWLAYEEIGDPEERAHSSVFDVLKGIATTNSPDTTVATESNSNSTPVLDGDGEEESTCDICCEKFEQFWEESAEEWHYRDAVRIDGKTYHNLCYQDAKESHIEGGEDEEQDPGSPPPGNSKARDSRIAFTEEKPNVKEINATENHNVKGEKDAIKQEASSLKDNSNVSEKGSSEECSSALVKVETEVDSVGSGKIVTNKDANGQNNEK